MNAQIRENSSLHRRHRAILAAIIVAAAYLRFAHIGVPSLWQDEIWSIEMSTGRGSAHDQLPTNRIRQDQPDLTSLAGAPHWWSICAILAA